MITLTHGTPIRAGSWTGSDYAETFTTEGYAAKSGIDAAKLVANSQANGHDLAGSIYAGSSLLGDRAAAKAAAERDLANRNAAVIINNGDRVTIEGREYTVKIDRRNEASPRVSDPIRFIPS
jgi:hypothetical protein